MANISYRLEVNNFDQAIAQIESKIAQALESVGEYAEGQAKVLCPVGQYDDGRVGGRLRSSISHKTDGKKEVIIGTDVEYATFVEKGTSRQKAQPYLTPAVENNAENIKSIITSTFGGL